MSSVPEAGQPAGAADSTGLAARIDRWVVIVTTSIMCIELALPAEIHVLAVIFENR